VSTERWHCGDHSCLIGGPAKGMATNGGCHCLLDLKPVEKRRAVQFALKERARLETALSAAHARALAAEARVAELEAALWRYGLHDDGNWTLYECRVHRDGPDTCDCGLNAALAAGKEGSHGS